MPLSLSDYLENLLLKLTYGTVAAGWTRPAGLNTLYIALYTTLPADDGTGGVEVSGGSYARVAVTNNSGFTVTGNQVVNAADIVFTDPTLNWGTVVGFGILDAASGGNLLDFGPFIGAQKNFTAVASTDVFTSAGHGFTDGQRVRQEALPGLSLPGNVTAGVTRYIRDATTDTYKLAATAGGAAMDVSSDGAGVIYVWRDKVVDAGDTFKIPAGSLVITRD
jgi:hypothetical protein